MFLETGIYITRSINDKEDLGFLYLKDYPFVHDDCLRMRVNTFLGHIHDHQGGCKIKSGSASGEYVFYDSPPEADYTVLVLGGSTTDGFFYQFSDGETWPYHLSKLCDSCRIINGGVGAYSSSQELLKLMISGLLLQEKIDLVVSLNGINDIKNYNYLSEDLRERYPYYTETTLRLMDSETYFPMNRRFADRVLPNIMNLLHHLNYRVTGSWPSNRPKTMLSRLNNTNLETALGAGRDVTQVSNVQQWKKNVSAMAALAGMENIPYLVFLQPTIGLEGAQSMSPPKHSEDLEIFDRVMGSKKYVENLRASYAGFKQECSRLKFCFDISDVAPPTGSLYSDGRHHNSKGNFLIAEVIHKIAIQGRVAAER